MTQPHEPVEKLAERIVSRYVGGAYLRGCTKEAANDISEWLRSHGIDPATMKQQPQPAPPVEPSEGDRGDDQSWRNCANDIIALCECQRSVGSGVPTFDLVLDCISRCLEGDKLEYQRMHRVAINKENALDHARGIIAIERVEHEKVKAECDELRTQLAAAQKRCGELEQKYNNLMWVIRFMNDNMGPFLDILNTVVKRATQPTSEGA